MIESLICGATAAVVNGPRCALVVQRHPLRLSGAALVAAVANARAGDCIAYAIPLDTPLPLRLLTVVTIRFQLQRIERRIRRVGAQVVARYGVDPGLDAPACLFELNTPAAEYAARYLRPRGSAVAIRRIFARSFGCDPALGGIVVVGRKPCS